MYMAVRIKKPHEALPTRSPISSAIPMFNKMKISTKIKTRGNIETTLEAMSDVLSTSLSLKRFRRVSTYSVELPISDSTTLVCLSINGK